MPRWSPRLRRLLLAPLLPCCMAAPAFAQAGATPDGLLAAPASSTTAPPHGTGPGASRQAWTAAAALSPGINMSVFAAPREGDWGLRLDERWVDALAKAGFRSVRLQVRWSNHAAPSADARLDEAFAKRIDGVVDALLARGLGVVMCMSFYSQLDGAEPAEHEAPVSPAAVRPRFVNLWRQLAERYAGRPARLVFELYNAPRGEPHAWNALAAEALAAIRPSNPHRVVAVGPLSNDPAELYRLALPRDAHLIVTFHNRHPNRFTDQGSPWYEGADQWLGTPCCDADQRQSLAAPLERARAWSQAHRYPVWLGSFGAASTAPMAGRANYLRAMREEAQARGIPWTHTDFAANFNVREPPLDSGIYDVTRRRWHMPLLDALFGP